MNTGGHNYGKSWCPPTTGRTQTMTAALIEPATEDKTVAPSVDELETAYEILDRLWDAIMAVNMAEDLTENDDALAGMERDALLAARSVIHRHMLVTRFPGQHTDHYRVHVS